MIFTIRGGLRLVDSWTRRRVAVSVALSLVLAALEMAAFGALYVLIDSISDEGDGSTFPWLRRLLGVADQAEFVTRLAVAVVGLLLLKSALFVLMARWQARVQSETESRLAARLYREYIDQDYLIHIESNSAVLIRNLTASVGIVSNSVIGAFTTAVTDGIVLAGVFLTVVAAEPTFGLVIALYLAVVVAGYLAVFAPVIQRVSSRDHELSQDTLKSMQEGFSGIKAVHVFDVATEVADRYREQRALLARSRRVATFVQRLPQYYLEICLVLGIAGMTMVLLRLRSDQEAFALLALLVAVALRVLPAVSRLLGAVNGIRSGRPAIETLTTLRPVPTVTAKDSAVLDVPSLRQGVRFEKLSFCYPRAITPSLADIDFTILAGESVGVVGRSGSGKTTLVDLLLGLLAPTTGSVLIDGVPLVSANVNSWRRQVGYVPQETYLMDASVLDNVVFHRRLADPSSTVAQVWSALEASHLADFVRLLPAQLDTVVGERGARLSGGQRQRLGIARALLLQPRVLVLDEATSALDGPTEKAITSTIQALQGAVTQVIIAHRLSTVQACDRIVLVENGRVVDDGTFSQLLARNANFGEMVRRADVLTGWVE